MVNRTQALTMARIFRLCPPSSVMKSAAPDQVNHHLRICPYCNEPTDDDIELWDDLAASLGEVFFKEEMHQPITEGAIVYLKKESGHWANGYYYNPPLVMVLDADSITDEILVAQGYHDTLMAGPGDLILTDEQGINGKLFIEPWNVYTLRRSDIGPVIEKVSADVVKEIKLMEETTGYKPTWAPELPPLKENDPRLFFRQMEIEVGYSFASRAVDDLLDRIEEASLSEYENPSELIKEIADLNLNLSWKEGAATPEELLCTLCFDTEKLVMAASSKEAAYENRPSEELMAKLVYLSDGRVKNILPVMCEIYARDTMDGNCMISGRLFGIPEELKETRLICMLQDEDGIVNDASYIDWDEEKGYFTATFKDCKNAVGEFVISVLVELN